MSASSRFLRSALTEQNPFIATDEVAGWMATLRRRSAFDVERIPFDGLRGWSFADDTGNLVHESGRFFGIEGISIETSHQWVSTWDQPIINQPETGLLGFVVREQGGILYFLTQAKAEPGNINGLQLSPTVQATRSNYSRVHRGQSTPYLDLFLESAPTSVLVDSLQPEQGGRFLRKQNRNLIVEVIGELPVLEHYCWLTLGQLQRLVREDNCINMDARSVLSCIPYFDLQNRRGMGSDLAVERERLSEFGRELLDSSFHVRDELNAVGEIVDWVTDLKRQCRLSVELVPLKDVREWERDESSIYHRDRRYFEVIAVGVSGGHREVEAWTQPMVKPQQTGIVAFLCRKVGGVMQFLIQAKLEPGNFDILELAPTVQCITGSYSEAPADKRPEFLDYVIDAPESAIRFSAFQSEEGGRFYCEENRNLVIEVGEDFTDEVPPYFRWMTLNEIRQLITYSSYLNVEARSLVSCLGFR
jgi:oxidase EvaA